VTLTEAKQFLAYRYVHHHLYRFEINPWHSNYAIPDVRQTIARVRMRQGQAMLRVVGDE